MTVRHKNRGRTSNVFASKKKVATKARTRTRLGRPRFFSIRPFSSHKKWGGFLGDPRAAGVDEETGVNENRGCLRQVEKRLRQSSKSPSPLTLSCQLRTRPSWSVVLKSLDSGATLSGGKNPPMNHSTQKNCIR